MPNPCQFPNRHFRFAEPGGTTEEAHSSRPIGAADATNECGIQDSGIQDSGIQDSGIQNRPAPAVQPCSPQPRRFTPSASPARGRRLHPVRHRGVVGGRRGRQCVRQSVARCGRQPGVRGRWQRWGRVRERLRRALQPWLRRRRRGSWTVQYAPAAGTGWQTTALSGSIAPGRFYLVALASTAAVGTALPKPDAAGTTNLAASGGKVARGPRRGSAHVRCCRRELFLEPARRRSRRLRVSGRLRGQGACAGSRQHDRGGARRRRLH